MGKDYNTGNYNTGNYNTGYYNTGNYNTGNYNTGYSNTGNYNTGNYNTGNYNTGDCNTATDKRLRLFNKDSGWERFDSLHHKFRRLIEKYTTPLTEWVSASSMSDEEKVKYPTYKSTGGYLKINKTRYKSIEITPDDREFLLTVPNFDKDIFKECTGIDIDNTKVKIIIDGKEIWISADSAKNMIESLCNGCK